MWNTIDEVVMEDYELTIATIAHYRDKACECVRSNCARCEAMYQYKDKICCCFDTVIRFIEWSNQYNT